MTTTITISLTDAEFFALSTVALDPQEWAETVITDRARVAKEALKASPAWATVAAAAGTDDDWAILLHGRDTGLFCTAAQGEAERVAAAAQQRAEQETERLAAAALQAADFDARVAAAVAAVLASG